MSRRSVGIVLPVFDEADNLALLHRRLTAVADQRPDLDVELLFVDDGSSDASVERIVELRAADPRVSLLALSRNFGHQLAITAGLDACADHDAVIVMDADLQDPPEVCLELLARWEDGADVVHAQRRSRRDSAPKRATAWLYYWLLARAASVEIPRNVGDFRLLSRRAVAEVARYREHDRYLRGIVAQVGFRQEVVLFDRDERASGSSGYTWRAMAKLATDGLLGFSTLPLRVISGLGVAVSVVAGLLAAYVLWVRVFEPDRSVPGWAFLGVGLFLLGGIQLLMMGVIGSYLGRVYVESQGRPLYAVALMARAEQAGPALDPEPDPAPGRG